MNPTKESIVDRLVAAAKTNRRGSTEAINAVVATILAIVGVAISLYAVASIVPGAFATLTASLTGTDGGTLLLKGVLLIVVALVIIILFFKLIPS